MTKRCLYVMLFILSATMFYAACDGKYDDGVKTTCCGKGYFVDSIYNNFECFPVGTVWEVSYSHDDYKAYGLTVRYEVVKDRIADMYGHVAIVKGVLTRLDTAGVHVDSEMMAVMTGSTEHLDFELRESRGLILAVENSTSGGLQSNLFRSYEFNWPPVSEMNQYSTSSDFAGSERRTATLLDGQEYEYCVDAQGCIIIKTIGCINVMFADWNRIADTPPLHRQLKKFWRNGVLIYDSSQIVLSKSGDENHRDRF